MNEKVPENIFLFKNYRLFNWDCKKGGSGIEDLPTVLNTAVDATLKNMEALGAYTADKAHR